MATKKKINFEKSLDELESLIETMEDGDQSLEESLKSFEKGIKLTRECQQALQEAEQKVEILLKEHSEDGPVTEDFDQGDE